MPDLYIELGNVTYLCDVVVTDPLAKSNLDKASRQLGAANWWAKQKRTKYAGVEEALRAQHCPFALETTGGFSASAKQLMLEIHNTAKAHTTWRDADTIGSHLLSSIAIAVQKCTGMALRASGQKEADLVFGQE